MTMSLNTHAVVSSVFSQSDLFNSRSFLETQPVFTTMTVLLHALQGTNFFLKALCSESWENPKANFSSPLDTQGQWSPVLSLALCSKKVCSQESWVSAALQSAITLLLHHHLSSFFKTPLVQRCNKTHGMLLDWAHFLSSRTISSSRGMFAVSFSQKYPTVIFVGVQVCWLWWQKEWCNNSSFRVGKNRNTCTVLFFLCVLEVLQWLKETFPLWYTWYKWWYKSAWAAYA